MARSLRAVELASAASTMSGRYELIPYPPIEKLGLIGDRRTAAMVAADGTIGWMCLPNYDGSAVFGALLDAGKGGSWKLGPKSRSLGRQEYVFNSAALTTTWTEGENRLELLDLMLWPQDERKQSDLARRAVLRRLKCTSGLAECQLSFVPRHDFDRPFSCEALDEHTIVFSGPMNIALWCSKSLRAKEHFAEAEFHLSAGQQVWCVCGPGEESVKWTPETAAEAGRSTIEFWQNWLSAIDFRGGRREPIRRSALLVHLLTFASTGAVIAAPTASLPERIGGGRNYDYRYTWIRDASLSLALHSKLGSTADAKRFMHWLSGLKSQTSTPLQVLYRIDGGCDSPVVERHDLYGYRGSRPVRFGNVAASMIEIDLFGYLADCVLAYLNHGGEWAPKFWELIWRIAEYTASNWHRRGSSIWEIRPEQDFVASKVMSWVTLDRALQIAEKVGEGGHFAGRWEHVRGEIHAEVMERGWSEQLSSFRQRYGAEVVDAALLLIPIMNFLPVNHPKVSATIGRVIEHLDVNGFLQRFVASELPDQGSLPIGEEEGGFLMCSFWLAQVHALRGDLDRAEAILGRAEAIAGPLGLFAEGVDARTNSFLGNMPLLFSQVEYAKAAIALTEAREQWARR